MMLRLVLLLAGLASLAPAVTPVAHATTANCAGPAACPNLQALEAQDLRIDTIGKRRRLRFSTITQNIGSGALELRGGDIVHGKSKQRVYQRIYTQPSPDGVSFTEVPVGEFVYHPQHKHFHLEDYALYELLSVPPDPSLRRTSSKTSFCVQDTLPITWQSLTYGADSQRYHGCNGTLQGMARGWADRYGYQLAGQELDITGLPPGCYDLRITVNPLGKLHESNELDNASTRRITLSGTTVQDGCSTG